jgi:hypothetical protein
VRSAIAATENLPAICSMTAMVSAGETDEGGAGRPDLTRLGGLAETP